MLYWLCTACALPLTRWERKAGDLGAQMGTVFQQEENNNNVICYRDDKEFSGGQKSLATDVL